MSGVDLLSLVLTLRPLEPPKAEAVLPTWWGRAAHALLLSTARSYDSALAETLHDPHEMRPFTVSTLMGRFPGGRYDPGQTYALRLTAFQDGLVAILVEAARSGPLAPGKTVELDYIPFRIERVEPGAELGQLPIENRPPATQPSPWAALTGYAELSAPYLLAKITPPRRIALQFTSPTTFKSGGVHVPLPLPDLVFGSLLERWNAFAPIAFPAETRRYAAECLAVGRYRLSSRAVPQKSGGLRVGGVGDIQYVSVNYDRYWMSVMAALARFALFCGVGAGTASGLGQCRQVADAAVKEA